MSELSQPPPPDRDRVGPYTLDEVIAHGGAGTVYRAHDEGGRPVAVKLLHTRFQSVSDRKRFEREAAIRIDHENVIAVLGAGGDDEDTPYIALELLDGEPLSKRIAQRLLTPKEAVNVGMQVCSGLAAAHEKGIIHRDLKPENIFWCADGTIKVLDFGIALMAERETRMTTTGIVLGTPWYLSPEQARGEPVLDARVDVWGLGAVLYEALCGRAPFDREGALATVLAIVREQLQPLVEAAEHVPASLGAVVDRCLAKDPDMRWQSMEALRAAFAELDLEDVGSEAAASERQPRPTIAHGEQRVVAVLLAEGTRDSAAIRLAVEQWGGSYLPLLGKRAVGLFGGSATEGDELDRAASAAMAASDAAQHISVAAGRATSKGSAIDGAALRAAERSAKAQVEGIAVDSRAARALAERFALVPTRADVFRLLHRRPSTPVPPAAPTDRIVSPLYEGGTAARQESPLFGRTAELAQLEQAADRCLDEQQAVGVVVVGPAGIGKGRLRREMAGMLVARERNIQVLQARADPLARSSALSLLAAALRRRARTGTSEEGWPSIEPDASNEERQRAVLALARAAIADEERVQETAPFLGELLGVPMPDTTELEAARFDPQLMADRLRIAIRDWVEGAIAEAPLALLAENLQWADAASLEVLEDLLDRLADEPFLLFGTTRPWLREQRPDFLAGEDVHWVEPRGLGAKDVAALAGHIAGRELPEGVVRALVERSEGNPLFVEQLVLELEERGGLEDDDEHPPLPVSVEAAIQSRLDYLPHLEKTLCKRAAVLGRPFSVQEVEALGVADARMLLDSLRRRGMVAARRTSRVGKGREYRFRSPLIAEVAYNLLADDLRQELHRRAAMALARSSISDDEEIALHHERGGEPEAAAERYVRAALSAARHGDNETVLRCTDHALELGVPTRSDRYAVHMARAEAFHFLARFEEQQRDVDAALEEAATDVERARALTERVVGLWRTGQVDEAVRAAGEATAAARDAGDPEVLGLARAREAVCNMYAGQLPEARAALEEVEPLATRGSAWLRAMHMAVRAQLVNFEGDLAARRVAYERASVLWKEVGDLRRIANNESNLADTLNRFGCYEQALSALRDAQSRCHRVGHRLGQGYAMTNAAYALIMLGRVEEALAELDRAAAIAEEAEAARLGVMVGVYRARARLEAGEGDAAVAAEVAADAERVAREAERVRQAGYRIGALAIAARAHLEAGALDRALEDSGEAISLWQTVGSVEEDEAEIFLVRAACLEAADRTEEAAEVLERGRARLREAAEPIGDPEWRERFLCDVAAHRALLAR